MNPQLRSHETVAREMLARGTRIQANRADANPTTDWLIEVALFLLRRWLRDHTRGQA